MSDPKPWPHLEVEDAVPCPKCGSKDLEILANMVDCTDCDYHGPAQKGPELLCDWRWAIEDWNKAAAKLEEGNTE
jgi:hypothetical protein